jgi:hypothetical protein
MPALAGAMLLLCATTASAQKPELIADLIRKADAGQQEAGFCVGTGWPRGDDIAAFTAFLNAAAVGMAKSNTFANGNCQFDSVIKVHEESGGKCVTLRTWLCVRGGKCGRVSTVECLDRVGAFASRRAN